MWFQCNTVQKIVLVLLVLLPLFAAIPSMAQASEEDKASAKELFQKGVKLYGEERYMKALKTFQAAYDKKPHPMVRVNIANCYDQLGNAKEAIFHFERFLNESSGNPEQRKEVKKAIKRLEKRVGEITLHVVPEDATIRIDQTTQIKTPILEPFLLDAGKHSIEVSHEGYRSAVRHIEVVGGKPMKVSIALEKSTSIPAAIAAAPVGPESEPPVDEETPMIEAPKTPEIDEEPFPEEQPYPISVDEFDIADEDDEVSLFNGSGILVSGAVTALLGVPAIVCLVAALGAESDYDDKYRIALDKSRPTEERKQAQADAVSVGERANNLWAATGVLSGGAIITGAILIYLAVQNRYSAERPQALLSPTLSKESASVTFMTGF